jgi:hypothetical protein
MICTLALIFLTKIKKMTRYCRPHAFGGKVALNTVSIKLTRVNVPAENGSQQSSTFTHGLKGPALTCPIMPILYQHFRSHSSPTSYSQTTKIFINNKETFASLIVLVKSPITK